MSRKTDALSSAIGAALSAGGAHLTKEARENTMARVIESAWARGEQTTGIEGLRDRHISGYIAERQAQGISSRTLQNEISHIRTSMKAAGREQAAAMPSLATRALGIEAASRAGTRSPATPEQASAAYEAASRRDAGLAVTVRLQETLGLRRMEALQAGSSLQTWVKNLEKDGTVHVIFGTKGGRERDVHVVDRVAALAAVREAQCVAASRGGQLMVGSLRQVETAHRHAWNRHLGRAAGIDSHQLRMAFAKARVAAYQADGCTRREALAKTSADLGHGDGRGRWVERVYLACA
jgi:site-specific recombinase XerD